MRTYACEICGKKIDPINRTLSTEFPMIYSGEITLCGDLCAGCKVRLEKKLGIYKEELKEETT